MEHSKLKNTELNLALLSIFDRYDAVNYLVDLQSSLNFEMISNELALEASLLKRIPLKSLSIYGGVGTNIGYAYNNRVNIDGYEVPVNCDNQVTMARSDGQEAEDCLS